MSKTIEHVTRRMIAALVALGLAGCATLPSGSDVVKSNLMQNVETAPTELQLACANAITQQFHGAGANVLPLFSESHADGKFEIILGFSDTKARCIVGKNAQIVSIQRIVL